MVTRRGVFRTSVKKRRHGPGAQCRRARFRTSLSAAKTSRLALRRTGGPFSTIFLKPPSLGIASRSVVTTMRVLPGIAISLILWAPAFAKPAAAPNLPLSFEPNRGQADAKTLYLARGSGYLLNLESSGLRILVRHGTKSAEISSHLIGATGERPLEALDPLPGHSSYFRGRDSSKWVTGVPTFA